MTRLLRISLLALGLSAGCEGVPVASQGRVGAAFTEEWIERPDDVPEVRSVLWVDAQQLVVRAEGDVLLRLNTVPGDAYAIFPESLELEPIEALHGRFGAVLDAVPIEDPRQDVSVPVAAFALTDLSQAPRHTILVRNGDPLAGVASYQRIYIDFPRASALR